MPSPRKHLLSLSEVSEVWDKRGVWGGKSKGDSLNRKGDSVGIGRGDASWGSSQGQEGQYDHESLGAEQ